MMYNFEFLTKEKISSHNSHFNLDQKDQEARYYDRSRDSDRNRDSDYNNVSDQSMAGEAIDIYNVDSIDL